MATPGVLTTADFRKLTTEQLFEKLQNAQSPGYYQMAVEELQRRHLTEVAAEVTRLHHSSVKIEWLTVVLAVLTAVLIYFAWVQAKDMAELRGMFHSLIGPAR